MPQTTKVLKTFVVSTGYQQIFRSPSLEGMSPTTCANDGGLGLTRAEIYMGYCDNGGSVVSGWHFTMVNIPAGAVITKAHLRFMANSEK